jgi:hypothetical protein
VRARRLLAAQAGAPALDKPLPPPCGWLRLDTPLPEGFPAAGAPQRLELAGTIRGARTRLPIRYQLYCGSVRLAAGRTRPRAWLGAGDVHALRVAARLDPAVAAAEGRPPLSLYFGRRSRAASPLGPEAVVRIERVR